MLDHDCPVGKRLCVARFTRHVLNRLVFGLLAALVPATSYGQPSGNEAAPEDECVLNLVVPLGTRVTIDGRDYGAQRALRYRGLKPGRIYHVNVEGHFTDGARTQRTVLIQGGRRVRLLLEDPAAKRPELVLQTGHGWSIRSVALSPDGRHVLTGSKDDTAILWDAATGGQLRLFRGYSEVTSVAFSPDGRQVLTGLASGLAILWDKTTGREIRRFESEYGTTHVAFSPDGRQVLTGVAGSPGSCDIWDPVTGKKVVTFEANWRLFLGVCNVAFSPDSRRVLIGPTLWDVATRTMLHRFPTNKTRSVAFSADGRSVILGQSLEGGASLWDATTGAKVRTLDAEARGPVALSPDGKQVVTMHEHEMLVLRDTATGGKIQTYPADVSCTDAVAVGADNGYVVAGTWENALMLWEKTTGRRLHTIQGRTIFTPSVSFSPDGQRLLVACRESASTVMNVTLFDAAGGAPLRTIPLISASAAAFSPDGRLLATGDGDGNVTFWDPTNAEKLRTVRVSDRWINDLEFSPDGRRFAVGGWNRLSAVFDTATGARLRILTQEEGVECSVLYSPDGRHVVVRVGHDCELWNTDTGKRVLAGHSSTDSCLSPQGRFLAIRHDLEQRDREVVVWDLTADKQLHTLRGHKDSVWLFAFSPDGRQLASGSVDGVVILWDVRTGRQLHTLKVASDSADMITFGTDGRWLITRNGCTATVWSTATAAKLHTFPAMGWTKAGFFQSPDRRWLLSVAEDATLALWDTAAGKAVWTVAGDTHPRSVDFSPDGRRLLTGCGDGTARLWDLETGDELVRIVMLDDSREWLVTTPQGLFDGSPGARRKVSYRVGGGLNVVAVERFFHDFYRPGLLAEIFRDERPMPEIDLGHSLPPVVKILTPQSGMVESNQVTVEVEATDQGGGVSRFAVYQNGSRVLTGGETRREGKTVHRTFQLALIEGENRLRVTAANDDGSWESEPAEIVLRYEKPLAKTELHLVAIGISRYADNGLRLDCAANDAQTLAQLFQNRGRALYQQVHVDLLLDDQATRPGIREALKQAADRTRPQDTLLVFLAGHGTMVGQRYYFVPHEWTKQAERLEDDISKQGLPADEISDYLGAARALKRVLILDTCASGGALASTGKGRSGFALRGAVERLSRTHGVYTIAASAANEQAQESKQLGHGMLSYALLAALNAIESGPLEGNYVQPASRERVVDVMEWLTFAAGQVPRVSGKLFGIRQDVHYSIQGQSFPILPLEDE